MKALIVGGRGQLGRSLQAVAPVGAQIVSHGSDTLDITDRDAVEAVVREMRPDIVFNAAAYTAVDKAESEEDVARAVNATAVGILSNASREAGAQFVHVSTDFVFDGTANMPYRTDAKPNPLSAYGRTKLAGERAAGADALIVRTAWVYGPTGGNFVRTMLRLMGQHPQVKVVADQIGTPTYAPDLAQALWVLAGKRAVGLFHYTDSGVASWYDFAVAIQEEALAAGILEVAVPVIPIASSEHPTPATRPQFSVVDKSETVAVLGAHAPHWRVNLRRMIATIAQDG